MSLSESLQLPNLLFLVNEHVIIVYKFTLDWYFYFVNVSFVFLFKTL